MKNYKLASLCMISIAILIEDKEYNRNTISYIYYYFLQFDWLRAYLYM